MLVVVMVVVAAMLPGNASQYIGNVEEYPERRWTRSA
jgi:hypothetical protein